MGKIRNNKFVFSLSIVLISICCPQPQLRSQAQKENIEIRIKTGFVRAIAFSPDGIIASVSNDNLVHLWDTSTGKLVKILKVHKDQISCVAFSLDGKTLVAANSAFKARLWDTATWKQIKSLNVHKHMIYSIAISPDGKTLAAGGLSRHVPLVDIATGERVRLLKGNTDITVHSVAFSPDGKTLASGGGDRTVRLWNTATGKQSKVLNGHNGEVLSVAFSPDGKTLASGGHDCTVRLWNTATGEQLKVLKGHKDSVYTVTFSPDGNTLASGGQDIRLWDINTGKQEKVLSSFAFSVAFNPDGKTLAVGGSSIEIWDYKKGSLLATLIAFSDEEWAAYTPGNYYICSENGEDHISFLVNNKLIINRYDFPDYKNEEALKKSLGQPDSKENAAAPHQPDDNKTDHNNTTIYSPPVVNIKYFKNGTQSLPPVDQTVSVSPVKIVAQAVEQVSTIEKMIVQLDGIPVFETSAANQKSFKLETSIPIKKGENRIKVMAVNSEGLSGHSEEIILTFQPDSQPASPIVTIALEQKIPDEWSGTGQLIINGNKVNIHHLDLPNNTIEVIPLSGSGSKGIISNGLNFIGSLLSDARESFLFWKEQRKLKRFENPYKDSHAILVAIDDYDRLKDLKKRGETGFKDFHGDMVKRAEQLKSILLFLGFPRGNIQTFYDQEAESEVVLKALKEFWEKSTDRLFFYFSGHGYVEKSSQNGYLVTYDYDPYRLSTTTIPMEDLTLAHAREIKAHHMLIALDSCYSGLAVPQSMAGEDNEEKMKEFKSLSIISSAVEPKARNVMLASTGSEEAFARNGGIFTKHLIDGLKGLADYNKDKIIQFEELSLYVKNQVIAETFQLGLKQEPTSYIINRFGKGKVVFILPQWTK
jgi:WD40 repeat protein